MLLRTTTRSTSGVTGVSRTVRSWSRPRWRSSVSSTSTSSRYKSQPMNERSLPPHLKTLDDIEKTSIPGLVEVLREEGVDAVRHVLWETTSWHRDYSIPAWRNRANEEQKRRGWEMAVRIEKILCAASP